MTHSLVLCGTSPSMSQTPGNLSLSLSKNLYWALCWNTKAEHLCQSHMRHSGGMYQLNPILQQNLMHDTKGQRLVFWVEFDVM